MCRIVVLGTSGPARPADIGLKIRSTFLCLAAHRWPIFRRSTSMHGSLPWRVAIIDKPVGDKNHGFESCQSSEQIASSPVVGFWRLPALARAPPTSDGGSKAPAAWRYSPRSATPRHLV